MIKLLKSMIFGRIPSLTYGTPDTGMIWLRDSRKDHHPFPSDFKIRYGRRVTPSTRAVQWTEDKNLTSKQLEDCGISVTTFEEAQIDTNIQITQANLEKLVALVGCTVKNGPHGEKHLTPASAAQTSPVGPQTIAGVSRRNLRLIPSKRKPDIDFRNEQTRVGYKMHLAQLNANQLIKALHVIKIANGLYIDPKSQGKFIPGHIVNAFPLILTQLNKVMEGEWKWNALSIGTHVLWDSSKFSGEATPAREDCMPDGGLCSEETFGVAPKSVEDAVRLSGHLPKALAAGSESAPAASGLSYP